jgi:uncharacterized membrane protein YhaH (DUF805 family)
VNYFLEALKNYVTFTGRATRQQYWMYILFYIVFYFIAVTLDINLGQFDKEKMTGFISTVYTFGLLLPTIAILARRLHDIGRSSWWILLILIPVAGSLVILVFTLMDSQKGENEYGESLKYPNTALPDSDMLN